MSIYINKASRHLSSLANLFFLPPQIFPVIVGPNKPDEVGCYPDLDGSELCENVIYLGKQGSFTTNDGEFYFLTIEMKWKISLYLLSLILSLVG